MLKVILLSVFLTMSPAVASIYSYQLDAANGSIIRFNDYRSKKILLVNIASNSQQVQQLTALQQLYVQNQDSLVIVAFPSNSFGYESRSDSEIVVFAQELGISFPIAAKMDVNGPSANPVYKWLANKYLNDAVNAKVKTDFQKYLIDSKGRLVGQFDSSVHPLDSLLLNAVHRFR